MYALKHSSNILMDEINKASSAVIENISNELQIQIVTIEFKKLPLIKTLIVDFYILFYPIFSDL